jgi:transposase
VFVPSSDDEQIIERVAALDIGKAEIVCYVRLPAPDGRKRRVQEVSTHSAMVPSLCELANRLVELGVRPVVMEATSDYWRAPFYLFQAHGLDPWLVNAKDVKHVPGPAEDRSAGCGVAVQARRAADAAPVVRATG